MYKYLSQFLLLLFFSSVISVNAFAKESNLMSQKLWRGLKAEDVEFLKRLAVTLDDNNFDKALILANSMKAKDSEFASAAIEIVLWKKYKANNFDAKKTSFSDISRFINDNSFFPNQKELRRNAEKVAVVNNIPYNFSEQYFKNYPAISVDSKAYLIKSKANYLNLVDKENDKEKLIGDIQKSISDLWVDSDFSSEDEKKFLADYGDKLTKIDHIRRVDRLLWDGKIGDASKMLDIVDEDYAKLFSVIIEISKNPAHIDDLVISVPRRLRGNEGLYYRRILFYKAKGKHDDAVDLLLKIPSKTDHSDKWWSLRKFYGRELVKAKKYEKSYDIFVNHGLPVKSSDFAEAEWIAGWVALRFMDEPKIGYKHFKAMYFNVSYPVSISRAAYWIGMSYQAMDDKVKAIEWYKIAAKYPTYFYGQLAIHKHRMLDSIGAQSDIILPSDPEVTEGDIRFIAKLMSIKIAYLMAIMGQKADAVKIIEYAVNNSDREGQIAVIMKLVNEIGDRELDVKVSKIAARKNVVFIKDKFQILKEVGKDPYAPLVHAIIKQESGFAITALSSVGALGFMQLMPDTAKIVARQVGVPYSKKKLSQDTKYNVILGSYYIKSLIDKFDGSEILAIASYNAGPGATQRWVDEFYDPRKEKDIDKVVDWIELITYAETRNYVQRIMENLIVYKYIMSRSNYDELK